MEKREGLSQTSKKLGNITFQLFILGATSCPKGASEAEGGSKEKGKAEDLGDADIKDLDKLPQDVIRENGGEDFTQELKKESGKSKSDLYWDKEGKIFAVPKNGGPPQWVGWIPR